MGKSGAKAKTTGGAKKQQKGSPKKGGKESIKMKKISRTRRAGLLFPVAHFQRKLRAASSGHVRVGPLASVYTTAVLEYLLAETLELASNASLELKKKRITPRHVYLAIRGDEELDQLVRATIAGGGVMPHIHRSLLPKKRTGADADNAESSVLKVSMKDLADDADGKKKEV